MRTTRKTLAAAALGLSAVAVALLLPLSLSAAPTAGAHGKPLVRAEAKYVCMINNQRFNKAQIAIDVDGKTYYGCCEMCKDRLRNDPESREAVDPVSGKKVDKATAVIGATEAGDVFYFESESNMQSFRPGGDDHSSEPH